MKFKRESQMEAPVKRWMEKCGYIVHRESALPSGIPDLLGYNFRTDIFIAIELKLYKYCKALTQAQCYSDFCHLSFIAFPANRAEKVLRKYGKKLMENGIGLLSVEPNHVTCLLNAVINMECDCEIIHLYKRFDKEVRKLKRYEKSQTLQTQRPPKLVCKLAGKWQGKEEGISEQIPCRKLSGHQIP